MNASTPAKTIDHSQPHLVIRASAGTGKTFQLSTRYLRLILEGREPGRILATTFTRKAAGEVLGRVLSRLAKGAKTDMDARTLADELQMPHVTRAGFESALKALAANLHRLSICTIDSFFSRLCQSFRHELKLPFPLRLISNDSALAQELKLLAVQAVLEEQKPDVLLDLLQRLHHDSNVRSVTGSILQIVDSLHQVYLEAPGGGAWSTIPITEQVGDDAFAEAIAGVRAVFPTGAGLAKSIESSLRNATAKRWEDFVAGTLINRIAATLGPIDARNPPPHTPPEFSRKPIPADLFHAMGRLVMLAQAQMLALIARRTKASYELLHAFDVHYARLRDEHRVLLFSDLTYKLTERFKQMDEGDLSDIFFRIDGKLDHLLFDEFQDTSVQQWWLLGPLSKEVAAVAPGVGGSHDRTFFCVGDVKQAIYAWRGGCAEIFDDVESELNLPPEALATLSQSRRSSSIVLDAVNRVFSGLADAPVLQKDELYKEVAQWTAKFPPHSAHKDMPGFVELRTTSLVSADDTGDAGDDVEQDDADPKSRDGNLAHLAQTAAFVAQLASRHPGRSIGVLTRRVRSAATIIDLLRRLGVEASGEGGVKITDDPAVNAILSAITMADHPGEGTHRSRATTAFHVFNTPLAPLLGLRSTEPAEVHRAASRLRLRLVDEGYARVVGDLAISLASAGACDSDNLLRLSQLVELADAFEPDASLRPRGFVDFVLGSEVETTRSVPVRVMTVHKAKGLEFDIVVLSDLDSKIFGANTAADTLRSGPTRPINAVFVGTNAQVRSSYSYMEQAHGQHQRTVIREAVCVMYVAMTRARYALHMLVKPPFKEDGSPIATPALSMGTLLRQSLVGEIRDDESRNGGSAIYSHGDTAWDTQPPGAKPKANTKSVAAPLPVWSAGARASNAIRSLPTASPSSLESDGHVTAADLLQPETGGARLRGSAVHGWFSMIDYLDAGTSGCPLSREQMLASLSREAPDAPANQIEPWILQFKKMIEGPAVRAALSEPIVSAGHSAELWRERAFVVGLGGRILRGIFDRVVVIRDAGGRAVGAELLDFKTDNISSETVETVTRRYEPQVRAYVSALVSMLGVPRSAVTSKLLFVGADRVVSTDKTER